MHQRTAFADRDQAKFFSFVADDAVFLSPGETLAGKPQVVKGWSRFFQGAAAPFSWRPERVGNYSSVWRKQKDGSWKVIFDGPGSPVCPPAEKK